MQPPPEHQRMIDYFSARGYTAWFRELAGDLIVCVATPPKQTGEMVIYERLVYLTPTDDKRWDITIGGVGSDDRFDDPGAREFVERVLQSDEEFRAECQRRLDSIPYTPRKRGENAR